MSKNLLINCVGSIPSEVKTELGDLLKMGMIFNVSSWISQDSKHECMSLMIRDRYSVSDVSDVIACLLKSVDMIIFVDDENNVRLLDTEHDNSRYLCSVHNVNKIHVDCAGIFGLSTVLSEWVRKLNCVTFPKPEDVGREYWNKNAAGQIDYMPLVGCEGLSKSIPLDKQSYNLSEEIVREEQELVKNYNNCNKPDWDYYDMVMQEFN